MLFISWFLHQTTTMRGTRLMLAELFISWFLHQTTTFRSPLFVSTSCLSLDSYIKPQLNNQNTFPASVVYLLIPTSNHNDGYPDSDQFVLFISWFLHQTTTLYKHSLTCVCCLSLDSYIKPQRCPCMWCPCMSCLSLDSYIKPQHCLWRDAEKHVVYLLIPTSNHNQCLFFSFPKDVVYLLIPTSNHNFLCDRPVRT